MTGEMFCRKQAIRYIGSMKIIPLFFLLAVALPARSQGKDAFYMLDANWNPTPKRDSARYFIRRKEISDTCWQFDYYHLAGPLIRSEQYRADDGKEPHGVWYYYDHLGRLDSSATYRHGKKNGDSYKYRESDTLEMRFKYVYQDDSLIDFVDARHPKAGTGGTDSVGQESEYPGGVQRWLRYLNKNLKYPERAIDANIQGTVAVLFIVDKDGTVSQPLIVRSVEYSLDDESLRVIIQSGKWTPAMKFGKEVRTYKRQPIVFGLR